MRMMGNRGRYSSLKNLLLVSLLAVVASLLMLGAARAETPAYSPETNNGRDAVTIESCKGEQFEVRVRDKEMFGLINDYRLSIARKAFCPNPKLYKAALGHSRDMADRGYSGHVTPEGKTPTMRVREAGHLDYEVGLGEVLAGQSTTSTPQKAFNAWMNSPGHKAILSDDFGSKPEIGIGTADATRYGGPDIGEYEWTYWTANITGATIVPPPPPVYTNPGPVTKPNPNTSPSRKVVPNVKPSISGVKFSDTNTKSQQFTRPRIQAIVRDKETNLRAGQIKVRVDNKKVRVRYSRANNKMIVKAPKLRRGKHVVKIQATDGKLLATKLVKFRVR